MDTEVKVFKTVDRVWFDDCDASGAIFNGQIFRICHRSYEQLMDKIGFPLTQILDEKKWLFPVVHIEADFMRPLNFGTNLEIIIELGKFGNRSMKLMYKIYSESGNMLALVSTTHVATGVNGEKVEFPEGLETAIKAIIPTT
jgi:1,4-dihydroxy-2-naphthoyl-CoA hydrolase